MPTYEYACKSCGARFEIFIKSADKSKVTCPDCASGQLQEIYSLNTKKSSSADSSCDTCPSQSFG